MLERVERYGHKSDRVASPHLAKEIGPVVLTSILLCRIGVFDSHMLKDRHEWK
jgi:hypothetical protein